MGERGEKMTGGRKEGRKHDITLRVNHVPIIM